MQKIIFSGLLFILALPLQAQVDPYLEGRARMQEGRYGEALPLLELAKSASATDPDVLLHLGICFFENKNFPAAHEQFYLLNKRKPGMGSFYLAKCEVHLQHPELAIKYLREHLKSRYRVDEKYILLDPELSTLEKRKDWQQLWEERNWYNEKDKLYQEAVFLGEHDDELEAINLLNELEKGRYQLSRVREDKARIYLELGNEKAARNAIRDAVKADVRNLDALELMCQIYMEDEKWEDAADGLHRLIRQDPARFEAYLLRARAKSALDDLDGARKDLQLYLEIFPNAHEAWYQKGRVEFDHGKYLNALPAFHTAIELDGGKADYFLARGQTYAATGTNRSAEKDLAMALDLDPSNGLSWFEKARVSLKLGKSNEACSCFRKAYELGIYEAGELSEINCK